MNEASPARIEHFADGLQLKLDERGAGRAFLLLHGGAGPQSMMPIAAALSQRARVVTPIHPGFMGEPRPAWFDRVGDLAFAYLDLLDRLDLRDVIVIGNSIGGWIAAEMGLLATERLAGLVIVNGCGIKTDRADDIVDTFQLTPPELARLAFHDPEGFLKKAGPPSPAQLAGMAANRETLRVYAGTPSMYDPKLRRRLSRIALPTLVAWGEADRVVDVAYGKEFAKAIPAAKFESIAEAGHLPQLEQPARLLGLIEAFAAGIPAGN